LLHKPSIFGRHSTEIVALFYELNKSLSAYPLFAYSYHIFFLHFIRISLKKADSLQFEKVKHSFKIEPQIFGFILKNVAWNLAVITILQYRL